MNSAVHSVLLAVFLPLTLPAALPDYLLKALRDFPRTTLPSDLGYAVEITRNERQSRERYDPSHPAAERWILLEIDGRKPTPDEVARHRRTRSTGGNAAFQADFSAAQIDRDSLKLETEDNERAVFLGGFTEAAADDDTLLGRLALRLTVDKRLGVLLAYELRLLRPFSPVLGVKIHELIAGAEYHRPPGLALNLPKRTYSKFRGRIFLSSTKEDLEVKYEEYATSIPTPASGT